MLIRQFTLQLLAIMGASPAVATRACPNVEPLCRELIERLDPSRNETGT